MYIVLGRYVNSTKIALSSFIFHDRYLKPSLQCDASTSVMYVLE